MSQSDKFKDNQHCSVKDFWRYPEEAEKHRGDSRRVSTDNIPLTDQSSKDNKSTHKSSQNKNKFFSSLCSFIWRPSLREQSAWEWLKLLGAGLLAAGITLGWDALSTVRENKLYHQKLVADYIDSVKQLILDEYHEAGKKPDIGHQEIRTFIKAKTATTIINLDNDKKQLNKFINFLKGANIGFRPINPEEIRLFNRKLNNGIEDAEDFTLNFLEGIDLTYAKMNNISEVCLPKTKYCLLLALDYKIIKFFEDLGLETKNPPIDLNNGMLKDADLTSAKLNGVLLSSADLTNARLNESYMKKANLIGANLENSNLIETKLNGAILLQTNLRDANLGKAKLNNAKLSGADIRGANFQGSSITNVDWAYAIYDSQDVNNFPKGFFQDNKCMIKIQEKEILPLPTSKECLNKSQQNKIRPFQNKNLNGIDFSGINLNDDEYINLRNFTKSDLRQANFKNAKLKKANLREANLQGANLEGADLREAILNLANLKNIKIDKSTQIDPKWRLVAKILQNKTNGPKLDLNGEDLQLTNLEDSYLKEANLEKAQLQGANLKGANLKSANLKGANLQAGFLEEDNPSYREKIPVNLNGAILEGAKLEEANLKGADITRANLKDANLQNANLTNTDLRKADLTGARLDAADLTNADLRGANLTKANLTGVKGANLQESILCNTTLPNGTQQSLNCPKNDQNQ